jgi:hypothetical protein
MLPFEFSNPRFRLFQKARYDSPSTHRRFVRQPSAKPLPVKRLNLSHHPRRRNTWHACGNAESAQKPAIHLEKAAPGSDFLSGKIPK